MKRLFFSGCLMVAGMFASAQEVEFTKGEWKAVLERARKEKKHIMIDMYFTGCMPCAQMDKTTFKNPEVGKFMNENFINYKTDVMKEEDGMELSTRFGSTGFPTYVILTPDGYVVDVFSGYTSAENFIGYARQAMKRTEAKDYMLFSNANNPAKLPEFYVEMIRSKGQKRDKAAAEKFLAEQKDLRNEAAYLVMVTSRLDLQSAQYLTKNAQQLAHDFGRVVIRNKMLDAAPIVGAEYIRQKDFSGYEKNVLSAVRPVFTDKEWVRFGKILCENFFRSARDVAGWVNYAQTSGLYDDQDKLILAAQLLSLPDMDPAPVKGLLENSGIPPFERNYTLALLNWKLGQKKEALALLQNAANAATSSGKTISSNEMDMAKKFMSALENSDETYVPRPLNRVKPLSLGD